MRHQISLIKEEQNLIQKCMSLGSLYNNKTYLDVKI